MKVVTQLGNTIYSNVLKYYRIVIVCKKYRVWATKYQVNELIIDFINCSGQPSHVVVSNSLGYFEYITCASEGSVNTNGTIEEQGFC